MIDHLGIGDEVLTAGGFFATVVRIDEDEVTVELSPGSEARLAKRAIAAVMPDEDEPEADETDEAPAEADADAAESVAQRPS
jgi:preprotein translocase subunit YajC